MGKPKRDKPSKERTNKDSQGTSNTPRAESPDDGGNAASDSTPALLQEILALGGSREDLDYLADVLSDDEEIAMSGLSSDVVAEKKRTTKEKRQSAKLSSEKQKASKGSDKLSEDLKNLISQLGLKPSMAFEGEDEEVTTESNDEDSTNAPLPKEDIKGKRESVPASANIEKTTGNSKSNPALLNDVENFVANLKGTAPTAGEKARFEAAKKSGGAASETVPKSEPAEAAVKSQSQTKKGRFLIPPTPQWWTLYDTLTSTDELKPGTKRPKAPPTEVRERRIKELYERARGVLEDEWKKYEQANPTMSGSDSSFLSHVLQSGTTSDRLSALSVLVQTSPLHTFRTLERLVNLCRKKSKRDASLALDTLKELLMRFILPDRKMRYFRDWREVGEYADGVRGDIKGEWLALWAFEDSVKKLYWEVIKIIEELSHDTLPHIRSRMISHIYDMLATKPEQEQNLLALLVNKMGDPARPLASKAIHHIHLLLRKHTHPVFKLIVVSEVERLLFRPNVANRARYYAIVCLNQLELRRGAEGIGAADDPDIKCANKLIGVYFAVFEEMMSQDGSRKGHGDTEVKEEETDKPMLAKASPTPAPKPSSSQSKNSAPGTQLSELTPAESAKMMSALLTGVNRAFPYSKLEDEVFDKYQATLFRLAHHRTFATALHALTLLQLISAHRNSLSDRYYRALFDLLLHPGLLHHPRPAPLLNLVYKSLRADHSIPRIAAFVKRLLQLAGYASVPLACGILVLIGEVMVAKKGLAVMVREPEERTEQCDDAAPSGPSGPVSREADSRAKHYDARSRDPLHASANRACLWELSVLRNHFHPTIALYSNHLLEHAGESGVPFPTNATNYDPLKNHTLARFLERFVNKNPKKVDSLQKGTGGIGQPRVEKEGKAGTKKSSQSGQEEEDIGVLFHGGKKRNVVLADSRTGKSRQFDDDVVGSATWLRKKEEEVPVDERFFWEFFSGKPKDTNRKTGKAAKKDDLDADDDFGRDGAKDDGFDSNDEPESGDEGEEGFDEDEVWQAMVKSGAMQGVDGAGEDEDEDVQFSDDAIGSDDEDVEENDDGGSEPEGMSEGEDDDAGDIDMGDMDASGSELEELEEDSEEESQKQGKDVPKVKRPRTQTQRLLMAAQSLGYAGSWKPRGAGDFASAEDFETVLGAGGADGDEGQGSTGDESGGSEDELLRKGFADSSDDEGDNGKRKSSNSRGGKPPQHKKRKRVGADTRPNQKQFGKKAAGKNRA
ncbi:CBF-domain-containing protein [Gonapodya prolifera JEL478]|uniref:CBF-domain-containing protein n=1 Tax=Gonapodya prolifera (strain JEL478) TaxID=1344416 RepID=A0A139ALS8_GONPJ|nr:CBF-domain-containing protein [Gonapodya prolifera JEL478]|eukprot:KXS17737.1 CBF-domain-containing protein [Gonapodya prolifera JEL478]